MNMSKISIAAASLAASMACASAYAYTPAQTFYAAGSSAQFNVFALAAGSTDLGSKCGTHRWTKNNSAGNPITLNDPRSSSIPAEGGNIWIVWDDAAAAQTAGAGKICYFLTVDSTVGVRGFAARNTVSLPAGLVGSADSGTVPLLGFSGAGGTPETLPASIQSAINGSTINVGVTDIRPEDAKFATLRALTAYGQQTPGAPFTGLGFGPGPIGQAIKSSQSSASAEPVDFAFAQGDTDPISGSKTIRPYAEVPVGAAPVLVIANVSQTGSGHFGDGSYTNVDRFVLTNALTGTLYQVRDISATSGEAGNPIHVWIREPLSGTYNTMEFDIAAATETSGGTYAFGVGRVIGQDSNINQGFGSCTAPCTTNSTNPFYNVNPHGATRARVIGSGQMISTVNTIADSLGYSFWGFSSYDVTKAANIKYLTVDGVDPLFAGSASNPGGAGALPQCTKDGSGNVTSCPRLTFPNIANGGYPIWSKYRILYDYSDSSVSGFAPTIVANAQAASDPSTGLITDFVPAPKLLVFRSHYGQVVSTSGAAFNGNNGFRAGIPETGGDAGGAVYTVQSELDYIADTGGNQQTNIRQ